MTKPTLEFVNDWSELESAVNQLRWYFTSEDPGTFYDYCRLDPDVGQVIIDYVPRLLTQYATLLETSFALVEGWEQYAQVNRPSGLFVPDHR